MKLEQKIKVSIITVVYNGENTIEQTINSVIRQDYNNIEYIIIDGASTDNTNRIIQKYREYIDIYISEEDDGLYYAMNKGILLATGDVIGIINSDDLYTEGTISRVVRYYNNNNVDVIYGNAVWFDHSEKTRPYVCHNIEELWFRMAIPHPTVFIKKDIYQRYGMFDIKYSIAADYDLVLRLYSRGLKFGYINENLAYFRKGGISTKRQNICIQEAREISLFYNRKCKKNKWLSKIQDIYIKRKFLLIMGYKEEIVFESLKKILYEKGMRKHIVIFGTGELGQYCYDFLRKTEVSIDFFTDNDSSKWGKKLGNGFIKAPLELRNYCGSVLIATYKYEEEIKLQLRNLSESIYYFSLFDWARVTINILENRIKNIHEETIINENDNDQHI